MQRTTFRAALTARKAISSSMPSSSPSPSTSASQKTSVSDEALYRRIFRVAARAADEVAATSSSFPSTSTSRYVSQQGYKPTNVRRTPRLVSVGQQGGYLVARTQKSRPRGSLVEVDHDRLAALGKSRRGFASTSGARDVAEESLAELGDYDLAGGYGGWDDTGGYGEGEGKGKKAGRLPGSVELGDYVYASRSGIPFAGVYLGRSPLAVARGVVLTSSGTVTDLNLDDVTFVVPSYIEPGRAARLAFDPFKPVGEGTLLHPNDPIVGEAVQALRRLEMAVEAEYQQLVSRGGNDLYRVLLETPPPSGSPEALAKHKPRPLSHTTAKSALQALQVPVSPLHPNAAREERLLAVHRLLLSKPEHFIADPSALKTTGRFDLRPRDEVEQFEKVREWVRFRSEEVGAWAEKAAKVREWGREQHRKEGEGEGRKPMAKRTLPSDATFIWSTSDLDILSFLHDSLALDRILQEQPHLKYAPTLVKLVDEAAAKLGFAGWGEERTVKKGRVRAFLAEIGAVAPWENWTMHERSTGLQEWDQRGALVDRALDKASRRVKQPAVRTKKATAPSSTDFYPSDPHDSVRHDFGSARVYTIDDPGASELDDGISTLPGLSTSNGKSTSWVYVHVADPTALLHPDHLLAKLARVRDHTEYFPERTFAMLPESFTVGQKLSLGALEGGEQRVLSLGFRLVDETGEVVENEVKAGIVRNVLRLTYGAVDKLLGYEAPAKGETISYGPPRSEKEERRSTRQTDDAALEQDEAALSELRKLQNLATRLLRRRVDTSAIAWSLPRASVSVASSSSLPIEAHFSTPPRPAFFAGAPRVEYHLPSASVLAGTNAFTDSPASLIVSEMMVAANRSAAKFAVERGLGVPFRQQGAPVASPELIASILALRNPENGFVSGREVLRRGLDFAPGSTLATPGQHWPMGIDDAFGYVQVTSPLRRYSDLFAHYQLKSALLPPSSVSTFAPAFMGAAVQAHLDGFNAARKQRNRLGEAAEVFWALWVVKQKLDLLSSVSSTFSSSSTTLTSSLTDADQHALELLSSGLTAIALRPASHSAFDNLYVQRVLIPQLGLRGTLQVGKAEWVPRKGEEVEVKIEEVVLAARSSVVVGLRR
ncbi:hypothetical protein JCM8547_005803 [Rhodosporidiobolus lusitaniae]